MKDLTPEMEKMLEEFEKYPERYTGSTYRLIPADEDPIDVFLVKAMQAVRKEAIEDCEYSIKEFNTRQLQAFDGKLPFVMFEGKADEKEKLTIYEQGMRDAITALRSLLPNNKK